MLSTRYVILRNFCRTLRAYARSVLLRYEMSIVNGRTGVNENMPTRQS